MRAISHSFMFCGVHLICDLTGNVLAENPQNLTAGVVSTDALIAQGVINV